MINEAKMWTSKEYYEARGKEFGAGLNFGMFLGVGMTLFMVELYFTVVAFW